MASTYVNDLRLNEMATGDESGNWGVITNTNLELIAEAFSYGTEAITTNADTHTTTIADGATDPGRALYLKYTGTLDSACTITIGPNTVSKVWIIENGTSGSQDIILSCGSGANITIPAGDTKVVYSDGAGAGAAFVDAFASLSVVDLKVQDDLTVTDAALVTGVLTTTATQVATGGITSGSDIISDTDSTDSLGSTGVRWLKGWFDTLTAGTLTVGSGSVTDSSGAISFGDENLTTTGIVTAAGTSVFTNLDISGDIDVDGTTNLDVVDIDGALTQDGGAVFNEAGADVDFRVESDTVDHALFVQGSDGFVGIGTSSPSYPFQVNGGGDTVAAVTAGATSIAALNLGNSTNLADGGIRYDNDADALILRASNAEAMRIDSSGNVGINTTSPSNKLTINSTTGSGLKIYAADQSYARLTLDNLNGQAWDLVAGTAGASNSGFGIYDGDAAATRLQIDSSGNVGIGDTSPVAPLTIKGRGTFSINNTDFTMGNNLYYDSVSDRWERLTASAGAAVYLTGGMLQFYNTTAGGATGDLVTATQRFQINSSGRQAYNGSATANGHGNFVGEVGTGYKALMFEHTVGGGEVGKIVTTASTVALSSTSDYRLKENVDYTWDATTRLKQLKPCRFNWIIDETNTLSDGFLAHEVSSIIPEAVSGEKDAMQDKEYEVTPAVLDDDGNVVTEAVMGTRSLPDYQGIDQSKLVPLLTKALQEQQTLIESLTTRLETLENA
jgi:hypothetical protein